MRAKFARIAPTGWLVAASIAAASIVAYSFAAIDAAVPPSPEPAVETPSALAGGCRVHVLDRGGSSEPAMRSPIDGSPEVDGPEKASGSSHAPDAHSRAAGLAEAIDPDSFRMASFDVQARAIARTLDRKATRDLAQLAADESRTAAERVAAAAILRYGPGAEREALSGSAVGVLRDAWIRRENDPTLAAASVGSLAVFGDSEDRRALLDESSASSSSAALARAGLSAARGDDAALEIAAAAADRRDPRHAEVAVSALTALATADDRDLSEGARSQCAEALRLALRGAESKDPSSARMLSALAALDAGKAENLLVATLADASSCDAIAQSAASALVANGTHPPDLERLLADPHLPDLRRALVAESVLRSSANPFPEARSFLERTRDESPGSILGRRAARAIDRADARPRDQADARPRDRDR